MKVTTKFTKLTENEKKKFAAEISRKLQEIIKNQKKLDKTENQRYNSNPKRKRVVK